ncbi:MAG TPA: YdcF family protein [Pyrinomonadaceae bacterium]|nr:YdcF family protein [Chloracidobacterium sp.]MBP9935613.1 YdcF family protein [Pyrinomonadaceae bacterium]MBK7802289.1 YdcF family protein [Chloracidobacterium sp.]MBK9437161.1 YdcF family protein [Chloracidobacterium sp.]MBL0239833.1 YdcF family protein [Chloracidobacterium sp.]
MIGRPRMILGVACLIALWIFVAPFLAKWLIVERTLEHADALMVLSGSAVYRERTRIAAELYKQGVAPRIFITDDGQRSGWSLADKANPRFVELEQRELIANGVLPDAITILPGTVSGTDDEAIALRNEIEKSHLDSIVIVTSAYHTRRALWTFEQILADKQVVVGVAFAPPGEFTPRPWSWWLGFRGWRMVAGEYLKFVVYRFYY